MQDLGTSWPQLLEGSGKSKSMFIFYFEFRPEPVTPCLSADSFVCVPGHLLSHPSHLPASSCCVNLPTPTAASPPLCCHSPCTLATMDSHPHPNMPLFTLGPQMGMPLSPVKILSSLKAPLKASTSKVPSLTLPRKN